ncbi:MAG TPA: hypothetical protein VM425_10145 [Myxococcota bacterium]|nr:hypothetical protein [Myxococcota bacterium]
MSRIQERIPRDRFEEIFRPMVRTLGTRNVIIRLNEEARTAIPRQTKLKDFMPKLALLCYEQQRPKVDAELERLWNLYFEDRIEDEDRFLDLSDGLNSSLDGERLPVDEEKRQVVKLAIEGIKVFLEEKDFSPAEIEAVFRIKAFPEVLDLFLEMRQDE